MDQICTLFGTFENTNGSNTSLDNVPRTRLLSFLSRPKPPLNRRRPSRKPKGFFNIFPRKTEKEDVVVKKIETELKEEEKISFTEMDELNRAAVLQVQRRAPPPRSRRPPGRTRVKLPVQDSPTISNTAAQADVLEGMEDDTKDKKEDQAQQKPKVEETNTPVVNKPVSKPVRREKAGLVNIQDRMTSIFKLFGSGKADIDQDHLSEVSMVKETIENFLNERQADVSQEQEQSKHEKHSIGESSVMIDEIQNVFLKRQEATEKSGTEYKSRKKAEHDVDNSELERESKTESEALNRIDEAQTEDGDKKKSDQKESFAELDELNRAVVLQMQRRAPPPRNRRPPGRNRVKLPIQDFSTISNIAAQADVLEDKEDNTKDKKEDQAQQKPKVEETKTPVVNKPVSKPVRGEKAGLVNIQDRMTSIFKLFGSGKADIDQNHLSEVSMVTEAIEYFLNERQAEVSQEQEQYKHEKHLKGESSAMINEIQNVFLKRQEATDKSVTESRTQKKAEQDVDKEMKERIEYQSKEKSKTETEAIDRIEEAQTEEGEEKKPDQKEIEIPGQSVDNDDQNQRTEGQPNPLSSPQVKLAGAMGGFRMNLGDLSHRKSALKKVSSSPSSIGGSHGSLSFSRSLDSPSPVIIKPRLKKTNYGVNIYQDRLSNIKEDNRSEESNKRKPNEMHSTEKLTGKKISHYLIKETEGALDSSAIERDGKISKDAYEDTNINKEEAENSSIDKMPPIDDSFTQVLSLAKTISEKNDVRQGSRILLRKSYSLDERYARGAVMLRRPARKKYLSAKHSDQPAENNQEGRVQSTLTEVSSSSYFSISDTSDISDSLSSLYSSADGELRRYEAYIQTFTSDDKAQVQSNNLDKSMAMEVFSLLDAIEGFEIELTPSETEVTPAETEVTPVETEVTSAETKVTNAETEVTPTESEATPIETEIIPAETKVTNADSEVTPTESKATPAETEVIPPDSEVTPAATADQLTSIKKEEENDTSKKDVLEGNDNKDALESDV